MRNPRNRRVLDGASEPLGGVRAIRSHRGLRSGIGLAMLLTVVLGSSGCVTVAEFRKLEKQVVDLKRAGGGSGSSREQLADTSAELDSLKSEIRMLEGRVEEAEKAAGDALIEARKARRDVSGGSIGAGAAPLAGAGVATSAAGEDAGPTEDAQQSHNSAAEMAAYESGRTASRGGDYSDCIDRFRKFLQTYPSSPYADDSAYWMADCHYKQGDYRNAVLRFDDVVRNYPDGNTAPDALYRQGESLLKLGPGFRQAAKKAFERVLTEYPDSARASQAQTQLDMLSAG